MNQIEMVARAIDRAVVGDKRFKPDNVSFKMARAAIRAMRSRSEDTRFVLGEGYLWAMGTGPEYTEIALRDVPVGGRIIPLEWRQEWWDSKTTPRVRLVAEVMKAERTARRERK